MSETVHILHTNDFHNHLKDSQAATIRRVKEEFPDSLLIDAGDAISAGNIGVRPGGEPILTLMSDLGYDAMTMGNREFHVADALLRCKINQARFPVLCANMRWRDDQGEALPVQPSIVKTLTSGVRIGVFGLTVPMVTPRMAARVVSAYLFDDPITIAAQQIEILRPQVDVLIALTHIGVREDERLAQTCSGLDLIIGGHSHVLLTAPEVTGLVPIVQAGWFGHYLGHVTLDVDRSGVCGWPAEQLISLKG